MQNLNYVDETVREIIRTEIDPPEKLDHRFSGVGKGGEGGRPSRAALCRGGI